MKADFDQEEYDCVDVTRKISIRRNGSENPDSDDVFKSQLTKLWPNGNPIAEVTRYYINKTSDTGGRSRLLRWFDSLR